ncbi:hypothetical protein A7K91_20180 [Paenibacillus oryzae]|uniref:Transposase n=1 Tax=Paenibacillus oryzae TaxID=1844972 RepID=A0A1A5YEK0_9BACL|nr:transposase [Paenibacillus oryzae]OBR64013.1 hypothetical protein A7K91_20180 [Paenibacillus oryzae]
MIQKLIADHYITMDTRFLDGTKIEANANTYSFVWKKSTLRIEAKLKEKVRETLAHIHKLTQQEASEYIVTDPDQLPIKLEEAAVQLEEQVERFTEQMAGTADREKRKVLRQARSTCKQSLKQIQEGFLPRLTKFEQQKACFGDRNSYSKTVLHMWNQAARIGRTLVQAVEQNKLVFGCHLHIVPRLQLPNWRCLLCPCQNGHSGCGLRQR